ncbi:hypothetical protein HH308_05145 [Gordonia sp. TBRC 11910]|uniref:Uncharacterized protein n=1 Tax=Gordonia asplenii TaxID=2725283 RepID=A0A848KQI2_9ACTN|nr:hypothetical protein [Gordonia asplenii]NMO00600.1 hypothetical protein [Gordonia asplenii]
MGKRNGRKTQKRHLRVVPSSQPRTTPSAPDAEMLAPLRGPLRADDALAMFMNLSGLVEAASHRGDPFYRPSPDEPTIETLVEAFCQAKFAETTAALTVLRAMVSDDVLRGRIARELAGRRHPMPDWLIGLDAVRVTSEVMVVSHELGDGENYIFTVELQSGYELTVIAYIDHNLGSAVKDAFVVDMGHAETVDRYRNGGAEAAGLTVAGVDAADARATIEDAIDVGMHILPPPESDTWPLARPLIEWLLRLLPAGGVARERRLWDESECRVLTDDFFASPEGRDLDPVERSIFEPLLWMCSNDPMRWSPAVVETIMLYLFPRKVADKPENLAKLPKVLRAFVKYCGRVRGISARGIAETLVAIDHLEPEYRDEIARPQPSAEDNALMLAELVRSQMNVAEPLPESPLADDLSIARYRADFAEMRLESAERRAGSWENLLSLNEIELPDEELDVTGVADDIVEIVRQISRRCDECADALFDVEHRTAMRRLLSRVATADPAVFRRKASVDRSAAAIGWAVARINNSIMYNGAMPVKDYLAWFGLKSTVTPRAEVMLRAIGVAHVTTPTYSGALEVGDLDLLTSASRRDMIDARDAALG